MERLAHHFEPQKGWINDPNGLCYFNGAYHAFYQHNPVEAKWGPMHWGHAISHDLLHWEEQSIALYPDMPYEDGGGCFSGSAVVEGDTLYLFYTSVSKENGQTQSVAYTKDGIHFEKYAGNPIIDTCPVCRDNSDFRDPKVVEFDGQRYMLLGAGEDGVAKLLLYKQAGNIFSWEFVSVLFESEAYAPVIECPDMFKLGDKYVLMFSKMKVPTYATQFFVGDFDGESFTIESHQMPEAGPSFYAPQSFADENGRRIIIAWMFNWEHEVPAGAAYAGALTIPREIFFEEGKLHMYPVSEAKGLLTQEDELVKKEADMLLLLDEHHKEILSLPIEPSDEVDILKDTKTIEVFVNKGLRSATYWYK